MHELDKILQHTGVKGMKWGIRRNRNRPGGADGRPDASDAKYTKKGKLGQHLQSLKRERQWSKVLHEIDSLSTQDMKRISTRIGLENDLKKLSKAIGNSKDKQDYLNRHKMDDQELSRKVTRLRAKETLKKNISTASKAQRDFGARVINVSGGLAFKYAKQRSLGPKDIFDALMEKEPKPLKDLAKSETMVKLEKAIDKWDKKRKGQSTP